MRIAQRLILVSSMLVGAALPALAQSPPAYPPACEESKVTETDFKRAHDLYKIGKQYLDEANYERAIAQFRESYTINCSLHDLLKVLATAYERKGDRQEAVRALEEYLKRQSTLEKDERDKIERRIRNLKEQMGPAPTPSPTPIATPSPTARSPEPTPTPKPAPQEASDDRSIAPVLVMAGGGAALVLGGGLFFVGLGNVGSAKDTARALGCNPDTNPPSCPANVSASDLKAVNDKQQGGYTLETAGAILGGIGLAAAVGGAVWYFTAAGGEKGGGKKAKSSFRPQWSPGYAGFSLRAEF